MEDPSDDKKKKFFEMIERADLEVVRSWVAVYPQAVGWTYPLDNRLPLMTALLDILPELQGEDDGRIAAFLLSKGADVNARMNYFGRPQRETEPLLFHCAEWSYGVALKWLLEHGADAGVRNASGETLLDVAIRENARRCCEHLFFAHVPVSRAARPADLAAQYDHTKLAGDFANWEIWRRDEFNAAARITREGTQQPLPAAKAAAPCARKKGRRMMQKIQQADAEIREDFFRMVQVDDRLGVAALLEKHPDAVSWRDWRSQSGMDWALTAGRYEIAALLLANGADIHGHLPSGHTLLTSCVKDKDVDAVRWLLGKGADVNAPTSGGGKPLDYAIFEDDGEICKMLIFAGAVSTKPAAELAESKGYVRLARKIEAWEKEHAKRQEQKRTAFSAASARITRAGTQKPLPAANPLRLGAEKAKP